MKEQPNLIIIRSVYGKVNQSYILNPCVNPSTNAYADCVRNVDKNGDMILSEKDKSSGNIFIPMNMEIEVQDGTVFDLNIPVQRAKWEAIKHSSLIAPERFAHDAMGELIIDGGARRYGKAVLYVEQPGKLTQTRVNKAKLQTKALNFVFNDTTEGQLTKCKLLGKNMQYAYPSDVEDFLTEQAKRNPQKIIDLYTGSNTELRMLFIDALNKGVIREKQGVFMYGDKIALGVTDEAVLAYFKQPANKKILDFITEETYPEYQEKVEEDTTKKTKK